MSNLKEKIVRRDVKEFIKLIIPQSPVLGTTESPNIRPVNIVKMRGMRDIGINPIC